MTTSVKFAAILLAASMLSACGGGGGGSVPVSPGGGGGGGGGSSPQANARETVSFAIPVNGKVTGPPQQSNARRAAARLHPDFIDANSDGALTVIFDGTTISGAPISFAPNGNVTEGAAGPSGSGSLPNGGSYSYTSSYTFTNSQTNTTGNQPYADFTLTFTTIPGSHTIGIVQTNGACDNTDGGPCISNNNGFVLAEGQKTFTLQAGTNNPILFVLEGVMESMYFCDAACDGQAGTYTASGYQITAFVSDESGDAIPYQTIDGTANGTAVGFDNGSYEIIENDSNGIVTITQPSATGVYSVPGMGSSSTGPFGENLTISCNKVGSTTVVAELLSSDPSAGSVTGFTYTSSNYPAAGSILSSVGSDEFFGNELSVSCSASGSITVQAKNRQ